MNLQGLASENRRDKGGNDGRIGVTGALTGTVDVEEPKGQDIETETHPVGEGVGLTSQLRDSVRTDSLASEPDPPCQRSQHQLIGSIDGRRRRHVHVGFTRTASGEGDFEHLITYLRFPKEHWKRIRHSNFIERTFGETRRRVKVIGRLPGEQSCLSLVWAVLDRASRGWRGVEMTPAVVRRLQNLRRELIEPPEEHDEVVVVVVVVVDTTVTAAA